MVRRGIVTNGSTPLQTNKFYANFFLGNQNQGTWTHPYSVTWSRGGGNLSSWGLSVSHIEEDQVALGEGDPAQFFINPLGIQYFIFSAEQLGNDTMLTTDNLQAFSVNVNLMHSATTAPLIKFPLVQGMGFVTALYTDCTPLLQSAVLFRTLTSLGSVGANVTKWRVSLFDDSTWLIYVTPQEGAAAPELILVGSTTIRGPAGFSGVIQVAKRPRGEANEGDYDSAAGVYPTAGTISAAINGTAASYTLSWTKAGVRDRNLLMFALPHHVQAFDDATARSRAIYRLRTTTKGVATAVKADSWTMNHTVPADLGFAPWTPDRGSVTNLSSTAVTAITAAGQAEIGQDFDMQTNLDSMYFSGKVSGCIVNLASC